MSKNILITGGTGLVGTALGEAYNSTYDLQIASIGSSQYNLTNKSEVNLMFMNHQPKKVIHAAAKVGGLGSNMKYKGQYFYENLMINANVIDEAYHWGVNRLVAFLTTCAFPAEVEYPLDHTKIHLGEPHESNFGYAYAKRMAEVQIRAYREQYGVKYSCVIPTNIYGPNDNFSLEHGHVVPMLIHKLYKAQRDGTDFTVWGSGKPLREFIFSRDVAKLTQWVLDKYEGEAPLILSTSDEISIEHLVDLLVNEFKFKGKVKFDSSKPDGQYRKPSDNSLIKDLVPSFKFTPIEEGIKETVEWFKENYDNARW
tara:strand:+ start:774 stop:1709 length:936 start_codon:yes stop_codon:yes gene_type:complete